jgi:predicted dehydrogenase
MNVGFIGLGGMGRYQAKSFAQSPSCTVAAGSDVSADSQAEFAKAFPQAKVHSDHRALLADKSIDALVIAVPTGLHRDIVIDALKSGRPVLAEKPMARTVAECREMIGVAEQSKQLLMVAHCRRFDTDWGTFADVYRAGTLGSPVLWRSIRAGVGPRAPWFMDERLGGGPLMDGAIHDQDFGNYLFGQSESVVGGSIKFDPAHSATDTGSVLIRYANGSQMLLSWTWAVNGLNIHDVLGPKATFAFGLHEVAAPEGTKGHTLINIDGSRTLAEFTPADMYVTQAQHFLDCIAGKTKCASPATEAIKAVAVAEAVLAACRSDSEIRIEKV